MKKCRVLELIGGSLTDGGAETLVKDYVINLNPKNFESAVFVDWVIPETANSRILSEHKERIFTVFPEFNLFWRAIDKFFRRSFFIRELRKAIRIFKPDVIHVHLSALEYLSELCPELEGIKVLYTCHSTPSMMVEEGSAEDTATRTLIKECGMRMIALHEQMAEELNARFGVSNTVVVNNGINLERFWSVPESKDSIRESLGIPADAYVIGHVGRFFEEKNHTHILKAFKEVKRIEKKAFLLLVGSGLLKEETERALAESGLDKSSLILSNRKDIPRILKTMDVFVLPSVYEGFPISLIEAQAAGLRCVVSDNVPSESYITAKVSALSLDAPLETWRDELLKKDGGDGYPYRLDEFDMKRIIDRIERLYLGEL